MHNKRLITDNHGPHTAYSIQHTDIHMIHGSTVLNMNDDRTCMHRGYQKTDNCYLLSVMHNAKQITILILLLILQITTTNQ